MGNGYNVAVIGGGIGGLMAAYKLKKENPKLKIVIIEKGKELNKRKCPASSSKGCVHCPTCSITSGYAGAGAFSDGKFNLGLAYGGTLGEAVGEETGMKYINMVDEILAGMCKDYPDIYQSDESLKLLCIQNKLRLLDMNVRHLGTDRNLQIMDAFIETIKEMGVETLSGVEVKSIEEIDENKYYLYTNKKDINIITDNIIVAVGRGGAEFVNYVCNEFKVPVVSNAVDIGVRVEMKDIVWKKFSDKIYEPKILYRTKTFEDDTRMFCFNKQGKVSVENNNGIITANGHAYADPTLKTENCNFAILSSIHFTEPFNNPTEYVKNISQLSNLIGDNNVIVQRFGDLIRNRRTTERRLAMSTVTPTLKATPGDLSLVLPHRILTNIIETIYALNKVAPGTSNDDTLLYGCESKYYSAKPKTDENFCMYPGIYIVGDCSGICRGLSQSGAMGLIVADNILHS